MEMWFSEFHTPDVKHSIRVDRQLYSKQSAYQRIDIFETPEFGRVLTLDGNVMLTERDVGLGDSLDKIIIGSIIRLVPGVALTTSIRDFLNGDYLSGTIRIIDAFLVGGCIAIGVGAVVMTYISLTGGAPLL